MAKKLMLGILATVAIWTVTDYLVHVVILESAYEASAALWRPMEEAKMGLYHAVVLLAAAGFVLLYYWLVGEQTSTTGIRYGLLFGFTAGISMGYGTYAFMPMPYEMALFWFLSATVQCTLAGWALGALAGRASR